MEVHHSHHSTHKKKWTGYLLEFFMLFFAVTLGFISENIREHYVEKERLATYLKSMLLDIESNISAFDSTTRENKKMIIKYDTISKKLLTGTDQINRTAFARQMGAVWYRGFINRNETFEQMKSSGSLRYINNSKLIIALMENVRRTNFAQYRTEHFEQKYYTEYFLPALYNNYDLPCTFFLDTAYTNHPSFIDTINTHIDILSGAEAEKFRSEVGRALMLRLERLRVSLDAYKLAKESCVSLKALIKKQYELE